ncbi:hypothetical protein [Salinibacterium sp. ZJ450]|uniref:hypothetical protein n=1 Tax=Salinibacterium sp. ZJ450 TaxID=2708338 RepID=UPI00141E2D12|nr:hypothetical protein [Salinibacterium sp. ZJ450]
MSYRPGAIALIAAPIIGLAAVLTLPQMPADGVGRLAAIEAEPDRFLSANMLLIASFTVFVPAMLSLSAQLASRASRWGAWAAFAAAAGWTLHNAIVGTVLTQLSMVSAADRAVAGALADGLFDGAAFTAVLVPMLILTELGTVVLAIALWRARIAPLWASIVVILGLVAEFVVPAPFEGVGLYALLAIGFGAIGLRLLRMPRSVHSADMTTPARTNA